MLWCLAIGSTLILGWIYDGYGRALAALCWLKRTQTKAPADHPCVNNPAQLPSVTVLITMHNEERVAARRLKNVLACEYPPELLSVMVASDGSTDGTNAIVREFVETDARIRLVESPGLGKTATQNLAIAQITSEVIAFSDADTEFCPEWLLRVGKRFADPQVGAVDGRLSFQAGGSGTVQASEGRYWAYEMRVRDLESRLGILAVVSGAAFALRRSAFVPMDPSIGEDCIVPLDVVSQGLRVEHDSGAIAYDQFLPDTSAKLRQRIRMTLRNWQGTWSRPQLLNPLRHPGYAFALWSHKLLRWLSPLFLMTAVFSSALLLMLAPGAASGLMMLPWAMLFLLAGMHAVSGGKRLVPGSGAAWGFLLANVAFLTGVLQAIAGKRVRAYRNV